MFRSQKPIFSAFLLLTTLLNFPLSAQQPGTVVRTKIPNKQLPGLADAAWQTGFQALKIRFQNLATSTTATERVEIMMIVEDQYILLKRNDILYRYNFYKTPQNVAQLVNHQMTAAELAEEQAQSQARLFHIKILLPFIAAQSIKQKIEARYGPSSKSTVDENFNGADIWELQGGFIFQWYEPYKKQPFTRTIDYLSSEMAQNIMKEYEDYFDAHEKLILKKLLVQ